MNPPRHIGILGGSFNPVHIGHMILADYIAQFTDVDEVWLMLSPLNPLKEHPEELISDRHRFAMLGIAAQGSPYIKPCDTELTLPKPSYTANSLDHLSRQYPPCRFSIIIGSDNWHIFDRWYRHDHILRHYSPIIYPRPGYPIDADTLPAGVTLVQAPVMEISSTFIRKSIAAGHCMNYFLPQGVNEYIVKHRLYTQP